MANRVCERPNALFWPILGARRSGKTWALQALEAAIKTNGVAAAFVVLRDARSLDEIELPDAKVLLLDEPGKHLFRDGQPEDEIRRFGRAPDTAAIERFLQWCKKRKHAGKHLTLALTPAEWVALLEVGRERAFVDPARVEDGRLGPLQPTAHAKIQAEPAAHALYEQLPKRWRRNPFLLTQILSFALEAPGKHAQQPSSDGQLDDLQRQTIDELVRRGKNYLHYVLYEGLTRAQRQALLAAVQGRAVEPEHADLLVKVGLLERHANEYAIADPVLAAQLPPPVRIHHVSDLHFGAKTARRVDLKDQGPVGTQLGKASGDGPVRDDYLDWLGSLAASDRPHLLVVSGDIAEWGQADELDEGRAWLEKVEARLASHPGLGNGPKILLVPGNHDVDWGNTKGQAGERKRHLPFALAFNDKPWPFPHLEWPPDDRKLAFVCYPDARLEFALLGSVEYGGQADPVVKEVIDVLRNNAEQQGNIDLEEKAEGIGRRYGRFDPGLVHDEDIQRLRQHPWKERVRIAVLHHPISSMPTTATEIAPYAGLINAGRLKSALAEKQFCLVLHGHIHAESIGVERWGQHEAILIASAATLGSRELQERHGFNEILIIREGTEFDICVVPWERKGQSFVERETARQSVHVSDS
ncbi:MAG: metallophosphoesterase [Enhygromyxa sp.]